LTFEVMNNLKNLCNSTVIQQVNENVIPLFLNKILKGHSLLPFFYV